MSQLAIYNFGFLVGLVLVQAVLVVGFVRCLLRFRRPLIADAESPKAAVVLALRGGDPFLVDCLRGLLTQDYPRYDIHVVVDHVDDPAHQIVQDVLNSEQPDNLHLQFLTAPLETCSLKCSSVVQAIRSLDESYDFVAQIDADTIAHPTWLRELATALQDESVGAATGNRWYMPDRLSWGALVRYAWNAAAVVQMYCYRIAWGGTLAVKTKVFRETDVLDKWSHAFCEDTMLFAVLKRAGLRVAFVPSLMMVNREDCDIPGFFYWVRRQMLTARLYHPAWPAVVGHGLITTLGPVVTLALACTGVVLQDILMIVWSVAGLIVYQFGVTAMMPPMEWAVRRIVRDRSESVNWLSAWGIIKVLLAIPLTQSVYATALASALWLTRVDWRNATYDVRGSWKIRLHEYRPYQPVESEGNTLSL